MTTAAKEALNCIEQIESDIGYYDMPEHEETLPVSGWALCELLNEVKRWRETHKAGEFNPDYCAASEALSEHLEHCALTPPTAPEVEEALAYFTEEKISHLMRHGSTNAICGTFTRKYLKVLMDTAATQKGK